jgi:hypothetical protein
MLRHDPTIGTFIADVAALIACQCTYIYNERISNFALKNMVSLLAQQL